MRLKDTPKAKSRTRRVGAVLAAVASIAGMIFAVAPATAAPAAALAAPATAPADTATVAGYPTSSFSIVYGASYYRGTVTWYNRAVGVTGTFKAVGCRRIYGEAWNNDTFLDDASSSTWCDRVGSAPFTLDANTVGGANEVYIWMTTEDPRYFLEGVVCYRGVSVCVPF
ncbi:hypothetical protein AB0K14_22140 [Actinosynnema sp. NPDC050801]|uniref:hypothetical protein n=1 Tax=unclassified Actinosynnema TaxID=2637065 RepID=UPI0033DBD80A